ncbi:G-protein gamma subunit [Ramicandelaber brevisporus]|nr:G-protein gamma subunit [Ramicandelaber brevisporus]
MDRQQQHFAQRSALSQVTASDAKLKKLQDYCQRLRELLELPRVPVSQASQSLIRYCSTTKDPLVPSVWGPPPQDPWAPQGKSCCSIA